MSDAINPNHYQFSNGVQVIDITENLNSNGGQAVQYIARSTRLDGVNKGSQVEDLEKAIWFCRREVERLSAVHVSAPVGAPVARVFNVGDPEPADRETIVLRGTGRDGDVRLSYGKYGPGIGLTAWWAMRDDPRYNSHASWSYWLENYGPLIEVAEDAPKVARMPRVFDSFEDIPSDVNLVSDRDGDTWGRNGVASKMGIWPTAAWDDSAPFTEVLTP